ncbi:HD domain-containing protein [Scopulibacillus darangshiensis]|uniref:HD domain-containing protein n=1 Tax=Scopulibacillus darangshiensis TaxID=442528 RepID=A0A4V2SL59_9BACL|nr:HD domain-containing protein [Scopulibacillus darangshiensis]TCP22136.1 HD domain-containing protein [Scopulibacillus darangshiensis]
MPFTTVDQAINLAAKAHAGQKRKATEVPYISHPYSVGMLLLKAGCSEDIVIAGILHDTIEDTLVTEKDIEEMFGKKVAELVTMASEPDKSLSWEERKQHTIDHLSEASEEACYVICADKLHNLRSMVSDYEKLGESLWSRFKKGRDRQEWYYRSLLASLEKKIPGTPMVKALTVEIEKLF